MNQQQLVEFVTTANLLQELMKDWTLFLHLLCLQCLVEMIQCDMRAICPQVRENRGGGGGQR